jgi:hypothetical protein
MRCTACGHDGWGLVDATDGIAPWLGPSVVWSLGLIVAIRAFPDMRPQPVPERPPAVAEIRAAPPVQRVEPVELQGPAPGLLLHAGLPSRSPSPAGLSTPAPTPVPVATAVPTPVPAAVAEPSTVARRLDAVDVRWTGTAMELWVRTAALPAVESNAAASAWQIDLPGRWTLPADLRAMRSFTRSNLRELRVKRDDAALRLTLVLRAGAPPPQFDAEAEGLRILVH